MKSYFKWFQYAKKKELINKKKIFTECGNQIFSYLDVERQVQIFREYEELRNVVLSGDEYKTLKYLTTPKIIYYGDEVTIAKIEKFQHSDDAIKENYKFFVRYINKLINKPFVSLIEFNLCDIHNSSIKALPLEIKK